MIVIAYSDSHTGGHAQYTKLLSLCDYIETFKPDMVIGVGNNLELVWQTWDSIINFEPAAAFLARAQRIAQTTKWVELPGNHNLDLHELAAQLHPIKVANSDRLVVDGVTYIHGHQFDPVTSLWWTPLQKLTKCILPKVHDKLFGTPFEMQLVGANISYSRLVSKIEGNVQLWAENRSVVFGHTHSEFVKQLSKTQYIANCGDFYDSSSFLVVTNGVPSLRWA